ncbi:hypothetical protein C9J85_10600 [Haloferax sp. wsp5]|nr:hypothetical protein C9J85_10600 [Haloferax sp. wsp5]
MATGVVAVGSGVGEGVVVGVGSGVCVGVAVSSTGSPPPTNLVQLLPTLLTGAVATLLTIPHLFVMAFDFHEAMMGLSGEPVGIQSELAFGTGSIARRSWPSRLPALVRDRW